MCRRNKAKDNFKIQQKVALPTKVMALRPKKYSSTGRLYLFWLLPTKKDPTADESDQEISKSVGFLTKILNMFNPVCRPIRGIICRPDKSF